MARAQETGLWELALEHMKATEEQHEDPDEETTLLFCGSKSSGKTSMILRFLDRNEPPKPTVALEYTFGRRAKGTNMGKDIGSIWELGGGSFLTQLIGIALEKDGIEKSAIAIVLDLSKPNELWITLESMLKELTATVTTAICEINITDNTFKDELKKRAKARYGEEHEDLAMLDPFALPMVIIGTKYDIFQDEFDSEKKKVVCRTLRFVSHLYGAHLMFYSTKHEALLSKCRSMVSHLLFHTAGPKKLDTDHNKPIIVPVGMDTFASIGSPMLAEGEIGRTAAKTPLDLWKAAYCSYFPQCSTMTDPAEVVDPAKDPAYAESGIDAMRQQKDQEFERYRRQSERKMKEFQRLLALGEIGESDARRPAFKKEPTVDFST